MCVCLPAWGAWSWSILVLCGCFDLWLLNVLNRNLSFATRRTIELEMFLLAAEPLVVVGVGGCSPFLLLRLCEGLPSETLNSAIKKYMTLLGGEPWDLATEGCWRAAASTQAGRNIRAFEHMLLVLRAAGAQSLGLRMIFIWEASSRKRIHVVMLFTSGPLLSIPLFSLSSYNSGLSTASQHWRGDGYCAATFYYVTEANYMTYYVCYITMAYNIN